MKNEPLVLERTYDAPIAKVWKAITDNNEIKQWYFKLPEFKAVVGFEFTFEATDKNMKYVHLCKVTEVVPGKKLTYSWRYDGYPGNSFVTWELFEEGKKTKLVLTHTGLETFPQDTGAFDRKNFTGGWTHFVEKALQGYLDKAGANE